LKGRSIDVISFQSLSQNITWQLPRYSNKTLRYYKIKAFKNRYDPAFYDSYNNCEVGNEPAYNLYQENLEDFELSNYDWMNSTIRNIFNKELTNSIIEEKAIEYEYINETISPNATFYSLNGLVNFAYYYVSLRACYAANSGKGVECSDPTVILIQTEPDPASDVVKTMCVRAEDPYSFKVCWTDPLHPNGLILSYTVLYHLVGSNETKRSICVPHNEVKTSNKERVVGKLLPGNYTVWVGIRSLSNLGHFIQSRNIIVKGKTNTSYYIVIFSLAALLLMMSIVLMKLKNKPIPMIPLDEIPSFIYVPDDGYECKREDIELLSQLGSGHFGIVYEGILKNYGENQIDLRVAVKTVSLTKKS
jgi:insulin-like growth factor 1 receptor